MQIEKFPQKKKLHSKL